MGEQLQFFAVVNFSGSGPFPDFPAAFVNFHYRFWNAFDVKGQSPDLLAAYSGISIFSVSPDQKVGDVWDAIEPEEVWQLARKLNLINHRSELRRKEMPLVPNKALQKAILEIRF